MKGGSLLFTLLLLLALLSIVVDYIYLQHKSRNQFVELQKLINEEHELNADWGRLQLEYSTMVDNTNIEKKAKQFLGMQMPEQSQIISIKRK